MTKELQRLCLQTNCHNKKQTKKTGNLKFGVVLLFSHRNSKYILKHKHSSVGLKDSDSSENVKQQQTLIDFFPLKSL